mmetsp:Transcript_135478/g.377324  ORF Transcript_135478/g.377324 Transcript_135478/m.377324 type:complete len:108 (-) Transcript_135478:231-554(-)|eukprot:CAMPEP_0179026878 /NCGR_PEP_ID=MMETSP0796-20121207/8747_1 /TAXON_ID=73915 /ORGANISM="Pyrodinium bahamense, Strain pbaha01" /LENGTH=107 /DNA_ID=CAMNT_0020722983 /DNA_START=70 /DNA_END=393 /DNA_ORIENTATION=+
MGTDGSDGSLKLERLKMTLEIGDDMVVYSPKEGVMSATYPRYEFARSDWDSKVGEDVQEGMVINFKIIETSTSAHAPDDPQMPKPDGGFKTPVTKCSILSVSAAEVS